MYKKILIGTALIAIVGVLVYGAIYRTQAKNYDGGAGQGGRGRNNSDVVFAEHTDEAYAQGQGQGSGGNGRGQGGGNQSDEWVNLPVAATGELTADEAAALAYMREEEKLAHDVYVTLYSQWGLPIFQNISQSEQTHTDAVKALLDRYGLTDPAASQVGVFTNPELQALYEELVKQGSQSLADALKVGAAIEEIDIQDLQKRLAQVDNADVQQVFTNLEKGSTNHLRSFVSTLNAQTGETYQPQYLSLDEYQSILNGSTGNGGGGNGGGWRGGRK